MVICKVNREKRRALPKAIYTPEAGSPTVKVAGLSF